MLKINKLFKLILISTLPLVEGVSGFEIEKKLSFSAGALYNNNVAEYSVESIEQFRDNKKSSRFSIESIDDVVINGNLSGGLTAGYLKGWKTGLSISLKGDYCSVNPVCSDYQITANLTQRIPKIMWIYLKYSYSPYNYVSKYRDYELVKLNGYTNDTYKDMTYRQQKISIVMRRQSGFLLLGTGGEFYQNYYNQYFTEYDIDAYSVKAIAGIKGESAELEIEYSWKIAQKRNIQNSFVQNPADCSYKGHTISVSANLELPRIVERKNSISVEYSFDYRHYTSTVSSSVNYDSILDPYHEKRKDYSNYMKLSYRMNLTKKIEYQLFGGYNFRYVNSDVYSDIDKEKNYNQFKAGVLISADFKW